MFEKQPPAYFTRRLNNEVIELIGCYLMVDDFVGKYVDRFSRETVFNDAEFSRVLIGIRGKWGSLRENKRL